MVVHTTGEKGHIMVKMKQKIKYYLYIGVIWLATRFKLPSMIYNYMHIHEVYLEQKPAFVKGKAFHQNMHYDYLYIAIDILESLIGCIRNYPSKNKDKPHWIC